MAAIDAPNFLPHDSRKVVFAIGGSLLLHAVLLAWLPPLVPILRDVGQALPAILEVRLVAEAPPAPAPVRAEPARAVKQPPAPPAAVAGPSVAVVSSVSASSAAMPAPTPAAEAKPTAPVAPNPEPAPSQASIAVTPPDLRAAYLANPRPPYPLAARRLGLEGRVMLRAEILENGSCGRISVAQSSGHELLDQAALQAVKQWRFVPAQRGGEAVAAWAEIPVSFRLRGGTTGS